jgi:hypothetical protein
MRRQDGVKQVSLGGHRSIVDLKGVPASTTYQLGLAADPFDGISHAWGALMVGVAGGRMASSVN